jgi:hypothetical protein
VIPLRAGETTSLGPLTIHAVPAEHPLASDAVGFVVTGSQSVYFSGDTRWTPALQAALSPFPLDVALVQAACAHYPFSVTTACLCRRPPLWLAPSGPAGPSPCISTARESGWTGRPVSG